MFIKLCHSSSSYLSACLAFLALGMLLLTHALTAAGPLPDLTEATDDLRDSSPVVQSV